MSTRHAQAFTSVLLAAGIALGCGGDAAGPDDNTLSDAEVSQVANQVVAVTIDALNTGPTSGPAAELDPVPVNFQYSSTHSCPAGGHAGASGSITGSVDSQSGDGVLWLQMMFTYTDCTFSVGSRNLIVNGNPSLTLTGNFTHLGGQPATQQTLKLSGALSTSVIQFCAINLTMNLATAGSGSTTVSGTVCGRQINI